MHQTQPTFTDGRKHLPLLYVDERGKAVFGKLEVSPSVKLVLDRLDELGIRKVELARRLKITPEYIYRILNGKVKFPGIPETLEEIAEALKIDPSQFVEYGRYMEDLDDKAKLLWERMRALGHSRESLYERVSYGISRPYFYGILRGDHPVPSNPRVATVLGKGLEMTDEEIREVFQVEGSKRDLSDEESIDRQFHLMLIDYLIAERGYGPPAGRSLISPDLVVTMFYSEEDTDPEVTAILKRMGEWGMHAVDLARQSKVGEPYLIDLLFGEVEPSADPERLAQLKRALSL